jgi:putative transposase
LDPANKKVEGTKRHLLVDPQGLVLEVRLHSAKVPDEDGIRLVSDPVGDRFARLWHLWVEAGYQGRGKRWAEEALGVSVGVVRKPLKRRSPRRWPRPGHGRSGPRRERGELEEAHATEGFPGCAS